MSGIPLPNKSNSGPGGRRLKSRGNGGVESLMNVLEGSLMGRVKEWTMTTSDAFPLLIVLF